MGFRIRGNVSRIVEKKSFKISMNTYAPGRKFMGYEKIDLKSTGDDSFIRPKLSWYLCRKMGIPSIWLNHVLLYINDKIWGIYTNVEHIDEVFAKDRFGNNNGNLYKCRYPATLEFLGSNPDDYKVEQSYFGDRIIRMYELKTNKQADDYSDLIELTRVLNQNVDDSFRIQIDKKININSLLKFLALEVYLGHWDSYSTSGNNYYLYHNTETGKFEYLTYDMDLTMGIQFTVDDINVRDIYNFEYVHGTKPLRNKILQVPEFRKNYNFYLRRLTTLFPPDTLRNLAVEIQDFVAPYIPLDPFYSFSLDVFYNTLDVPLGMSQWGIIEYFTDRYNSILDQLENTNTPPIFSQVKFNNVSMSDSVKIECTIEDDDFGDTVNLWYNLNGADDKLIDMKLKSQDTLMGTSVYETVLEPLKEPGILNFYIAGTDAASQTTRSPFEGDYSLIVYSATSDLRINELLASNTTCMTDKFGEHDDWVEIVNTDTLPISLGNKYMSDSYNNNDEWQLPATTLQPGEVAWFWCDNQPEQGENHAKFKLSKNGETVYLFEKQNDSFLLLDSMNFPEQQKNISFGLPTIHSPKGDSLDYITPGYANDTRGLAFLTFDVDMNIMVDNNKFEPGNSLVDVVGSFNNWSGSDVFSDPDNDNIYTQTIYNLNADKDIEYRFRMDKDDNKVEFADKPGYEGNRKFRLAEGCNLQSFYFNNEIAGINLPVITDELKVYPNPVIDFATIESQHTLNSVELLNVNGKPVMELKAHRRRLNIDLRHLQPGIYLVKTELELGQVILAKIVKL